MPTLFSPITFSTLKNIPSSGRNTHALTKLQFILNGPPDMRHYARVVHGAAISLRFYLTSADIQDVGIWEDLTDLERLDQEIQARPSRPQMPGTRGNSTKHPAWDYVAELPPNPEDEVQIAIGAELVVAHILKRQFRHAVIRELRKATAELNVSHAYKKISKRLKLQASQLLEAAKTLSNTSIQTYVRIQATLSSQMHPMRLEERQDAGTTAQLSDAEALLAAKMLIDNANAGCIVSLQVIIVFCLGIVWEVALDVPFAHTADEEWIAQLDLSAGITRIDLKPVLPAQARAQSGHVPSAPVLVRSLPTFAHELLVKIASKSPEIKCLRDINQTKVQSHQPIPGAEGALAERLTIAKFIASRGRIAKVAGLDAATTAYGTCDLTKIGKAKHSYITFSPQEIWGALETFFEYLNWGKPVPLAASCGVSIGSSATPSDVTAKGIDNHLRNNYQAAKAGKKYTLKSLVAHNNAFVVFCAHRIAFLESGRLANEYNLLASDYRIGATFGRLDDKSKNDFMGKSPVPIPVCVATQIELWISNLKILDARLEKLKVSNTNPVRIRIQEILHGAAVPLFFQICQGIPVSVGSADVKGALPKDLQIKLDDGRHYMPNAVRRKGIPSPYVDGMVRHHTAGTALSCGMANISQIEWLATTSDEIDKIAIELGFFPVVGLGK